MTDSVFDEMKEVLALQKKAHIDEGPASYELRLDRLNRLSQMLKKYSDEIVDTISEDYGTRDKNSTFLSEVMSSLGSVDYSIKNLKKWMKSETRKSNSSQPFVARLMMRLLGAKTEIQYQPLGTIGMIKPWNFPINLIISPIAQAFAAGNRVMIKPSEITPKTSDLTKKMFNEFYDKAEVEVFPATRLMRGKTMNAGQICIAPDYMMMPKGKVDEFIDESTKAVSEMYPDMKYNEHYTSIVNQRHFERINSLIEDAKEKGAEIKTINPANEDFEQQEGHKIPPTFVLNPTDDMKIMQEEIFGPVMPIKEYEDIDETISYVNSKPRPLALYYFGKNKDTQDKILNRTTSGGATINDVVWHYGQEDMPFGGVGDSGIGSYHGHEGFKRFSHQKSVLTQFSSDLLKNMMPPYKGKMFESAKKNALK